MDTAARDGDEAGACGPALLDARLLLEAAGLEKRFRRVTGRVAFLTPVALIAIVSSGCSDIGAPLRLRAQADLSATSLDFGTVAVNGSATRSLTLSNSGTAALTGSAAVSCAGYQLVAGGGPFTISPGGSREIAIRFSPGAIGSFPCALDLGAEIPHVTVLGAGADQVPGAQSALIPDHLDFGAAPLGQEVNGSFQVLSVGTAPLLVNVVSTSADYRVISGGGLTEIAAGGFITVVVAFRPQAGFQRPGAIAVGPGCPDVSANGVGVTISLKNDIDPILAAHCNQSCHNHGFLDPTYGYQRLSNNVVPFDPDVSRLYVWIRYGYMPPGGPLIPQAEQDMIRDWILQGATNY